jgi:hypothetical protein
MAMVLLVAIGLRFGTNILKQGFVFDEQYITAPIDDIIQQGWSIQTAVDFKETKGPGLIWPYAAVGNIIGGDALPDALVGVRVGSWLALVNTSEGGPTTRTVAEVAGEPWAIEGEDAGGRRYLLVASALDASSSTLPISAAMIRFVDWAASQWAGVGGATDYPAGTSLAAPEGATHVRFRFWSLRPGLPDSDRRSRQILGRRLQGAARRHAEANLQRRAIWVC